MAGRVRGGEFEPHEQQIPDDLVVQVDQFGVVTAGGDHRLEFVEAVAQVADGRESDGGIVGF